MHSLTLTVANADEVPCVFTQGSRYVRACACVTVLGVPDVMTPTKSTVHTGTGDGLFEYVQFHVTCVAAFVVTRLGVTVNVAISGATGGTPRTTSLAAVP